MDMRKAIGSPLSIIVIVSVSVLVVMAAFSSFFPPASVVESGSMQHSDKWTPGVINTGDLIFEKPVSDPVRDIVTYVQGRMSNFSTYGDYGNAILYQAPGNYSIVHRAMFYLDWNGSIPVVEGYSGQDWINVTATQVAIKDVGYSHRTLIVDISQLAGSSGFITMGDNNLATSVLNISNEGGYLAADQDIFGFPPIPPENVIGIAYGHIPWLGLIKLNLMRVQGEWLYYNDVPQNSYAFLALSLAGMAFAVGSSLYFFDRMEKRKLTGKKVR